VDEATAWLHQAMADRAAAEYLAKARVELPPCHAIAKWQQTVEKAVKAVVAALIGARIVHIDIGYKHPVEPFMSVLLRLPRAADNRAIQQQLHGLLHPGTRSTIKALEGLVPKRPPPGSSPQRNTEYPFVDQGGKWTHPAAKNIFHDDKFNQFRDLAYRILEGAGRLVSEIRRAPRL
jgi:hypothetical protein